MTHILGFSQNLYDKFPNPELKWNQDDPFALRNDLITALISTQFDCPQEFYSILEDNNGGFSHWEKQFFGNEFMIAEVSVEPYISNFTLSFLELTGWYESVNKSFAEPTVWGKKKGCPFLEKSTC